MTNQQPTEHIISQGRALVRAIEALETIEPSAGFERAISRLLVKASRRRLRAIIGTAPGTGDRVLQASENIPDPRVPLFGRN